MTEKDLDHLDELYAASTPGEWRCDGRAIGERDFPQSIGFMFSQERKHESTSNAQFVAAIHNAYPAIAAELRRLREKL